MTEGKIAIKKEPKIEVQSGRAVAFTVGDTVDRGELQERARRGVPESVLQRQKERDEKRADRKEKGKDKDKESRSSKPKREATRSCAPDTPSSPQAPPTPVRPASPPPPVHSAAVLEAGGIEHDVRDTATIGVLSHKDLPPALPDPCPSPAEVDAALTTFGEVEIAVGDARGAPSASAGDLLARALVAPQWAHRALVPAILSRSLDVDSLALALRTCGLLAAKLCDDSVLYVLRAGVAVVDIALKVCVHHLAQQDLSGVEGAGEGGIAALATLALSDVATALTKRLLDTSASARQQATDGLRLLASSLDLPVGVAAAGAIRDLANIGKVGDKELRARLSWVHALVEEHGYDDGAPGQGGGLTQDAVTALAVAGLNSQRGEVRAAATEVVKQAMLRNATGSAAAAAGGAGAGLSLVGKGVATLAKEKEEQAAAASPKAGGGGMSWFGVDTNTALEATPEARAAAARHTLALIRVDAALAGQLAPAQLKALAGAVNVPLPTMAEWCGEYGALLLTAAAAEAKDDMATADQLAPDVVAALQPEAALVGAVNVTCALSKSWQLRANASRRMAVAVCAAVARSCAVRDLQQNASSGARSGRRRVRPAGGVFVCDTADLDGLSFDRMAQLMSRLLGDSVPAVFAAAAVATARIMVLWSSRGQTSADAVLNSEATVGLVRDIVRRTNNLAEPERAAALKAVQLLLDTKVLGVRVMAEFLTGPLLDGAGWRGGASHLDVLRKCIEDYPTCLAAPTGKGRGSSSRDEVASASSPLSPLSPSTRTPSTECLPVDAVFNTCKVGAESRHVRVRESAIAVLGEVVRVFGPQVRTQLQQLKPQVLAEVKQRAQRGSRNDSCNASMSGSARMSGSTRLNVGEMDVLSPTASDRPRTESQRLPFGNDNDEFGLLSDFTQGGQFESVRPSTVGDSPFTDFLASMSGSPSGGGTLGGGSSMVRGRKVFS